MQVQQQAQVHQEKLQMYILQSTRVMLRLQRIMAGQVVPKARIWQQPLLQQRLQQHASTSMPPLTGSISRSSSKLQHAQHQPLQQQSVQQGRRAALKALLAAAWAAAAAPAAAAPASAVWLVWLLLLSGALQQKHRLQTHSSSSRTTGSDSARAC
jgi:hypothetical protein